MLVCRRPKDADEYKKVLKSLPALNPKYRDIGVLYAYFKDDECVGASWLDKHYPYELNMEYYDYSASIIKVIAESFKELFKIKNCLRATISNSNAKSNKMCEQMGFQKLYTKKTKFGAIEGNSVWEISPSLWKYKDKYPVE
jgi:hypothetical protein